MVEAVPSFKDSAILRIGSPFVPQREEVQESLAIGIHTHRKAGTNKLDDPVQRPPFLPSTYQVARHLSCFAILVLLVDLESADETKAPTSAGTGICRLLILENGFIRILDTLNVCLV